MMNYFNAVKASIVKFVKKYFLGYFPTWLPVGMTAWENRVRDIIYVYDLDKIADPRSIEYAVATMIISSQGVQAKMSNYRFMRMVRNGAAKQIASEVFQRIQAEHKAEVAAAKAAAEAEAKQKLAEATAQTAQAASNVLQPVQN